jgi:signal transduction histidine kinase
MNSLQTRLRLGLTLSLMLLMAMLWWSGSLAVRELGEDLIESRLEHDAESLLAAMEFSSTTPPAVQLKRTNPIYLRPLSGHYYVIRLAEGQQITSRSLWDQRLETPWLEPGSPATWRIHGPAGQQLLVSARHFIKQGHHFTLAVAEDITPLEDHLSLFQWVFAGLSLSALLILLLVQQRVVNQSLKKLETVRTDIQRLVRGEIETLSEDVPTEIQPLTQEFNRLLVLLDQRLERSRNALGNLAHALKGPLNLLLQYLDSDELKAHPALRAQAQAQTKRIQQLMERELKRARLAGAGSPGQHFNPHEELPALIALLKQIHQQRPIEIQCNIAEQTPAFGDREDMLELIGNLLDNACKWATSRVQCTISGREQIIIQIEDDGPGRSDEEIDQLTQRGVRLDENVEGHGIGLAITKDIVKLYGGHIRFGRSTNLGGLYIEIKLLPGNAALEHLE